MQQFYSMATSCASHRIIPIKFNVCGPKYRCREFYIDTCRACSKSRTLRCFAFAPKADMAPCFIFVRPATWQLGIRWTLSPMVDIARDPRWGRIAEGSGEDPVLGSAMATAYVRGYQGTDRAAATSIAACAKHYVGYGAAEGGRDYNSVDMSEGRLREVYLPPFKAAAEAGAGLPPRDRDFHRQNMRNP